MKRNSSEANLGLLLAAESGELEKAQAALTQGADLNCTTAWEATENITPLMLACGNGKRRVAQLLIRAGAKLDKATKCIIPDETSKETVLHWAILGNHFGICQDLLGAGASVQTSSTRGNALAYAVESQNPKLVELILKHGGDANGFSGRELEAPLDLAAKTGNAGVIKALVEAGAKPRANSLSGTTPLMTAAVRSHVDAMRRLLEAGDPVNVRDRNGWTPLMWAAWGGTAECVRLLLKFGAKFQIKNKEGKTALDLAREVDSHEAAYLLEKSQSKRSKGRVAVLD